MNKVNEEKNKKESLTALEAEIHIEKAKQYLSRLQDLDKLIESYKEQLAYWEERAISITRISYEPHYNPNTATEASFVKCLRKIDDLKEKINESIMELTMLHNEANKRIEMLQCNDERLLLRYRFINGYSWIEIGDLLSITERQVYRLRNSALKNFSVPDEKLS